MLEKLLGNKKLVADIILIASILLVALSVFLIIEFTREDGAYVIVSIDGDDVARYSLSSDGEYGLNGGTNVLVIEDGRAYIKDASCPDGLCIHQGKISRTGERIICLPNRVEVRVVGSDEEILPTG